MNELISRGSDETRVSVGVWVGAVITAIAAYSSQYLGLEPMRPELVTSLNTVLVGAIQYYVQSK